ncbi:MAG: hypothetical protein O3A00_25695 [Planctomycetota bacterium]|nr:hypothetical protein [Planctomycetota bacterium]
MTRLNRLQSVLPRITDSMHWSCLRATCSLLMVAVAVSAAPALAEVGDPQIRTDHPWYPGELAISTFDRLFATQAETYKRVTGLTADSDENKALASWLWRNTHYWHGEAGRRDLWGKGFQQAGDTRLREYWNGLFGYGFGLCGTTHSQWTAEFEHLLGHARGRGVGAAGHNAFEVFLQGDQYGLHGRWALLDHDLSTVIFHESGRRLIGLGEMQSNVDRWINRGYMPEKQRGWLVCGLHPGDGNSYRQYAVAEYLAGYAGPPPMVHLRRGERMRRYFEPGLEDGKTFVFWGRNYNTKGIPGPERSRTWVNQPERMHGSKSGTPHKDGQARFANVVYVYRPDFTNEDYREAVVAEDENSITFEFQTPYVIGATPPNNSSWGIYDAGCRNGLVLSAKAQCEVAISIDAGRTWQANQKFVDVLDLTDVAKGRSQYWLRFAGDAKTLANADLAIRTVCQANVAVLPRLKDNDTTITYEASGQAVQSMGPELNLAKSFVTAGGFGEKSVTMKVNSNRPVTRIFASAHTASGSPPRPDVKYVIECSIDGGKSWQPIVQDWSIPRRGDEPRDFWSQSFVYGSAAIDSPAERSVQVRFRNNGGKRFLRAETHLIQKTGATDPVRVTYDWIDDGGAHRESNVFRGAGQWQLATGKNVRTRWVEFEPFIGAR